MENKSCLNHKPKRILSILDWVASIVGLFVMVPRLARTFLSFPNNWFVVISVFGALLLIVLICRLCYEEKKNLRNIRSRGPILKNDQELMYQEAQNELRFTKSLQWNIVYYLALVFGAVFAIGRIETLTPSIKVVLYGILWLAFDYGIYFSFQIQYNLRNYRVAIHRFPYFDKRFGSYKKRREETEKEYKIFRDWRVSFPILFTILVGFLVVTLSLCCDAWILFKNLAGRLIK